MFPSPLSRTQVLPLVELVVLEGIRGTVEIKQRNMKLNETRYALRELVLQC